MTDIAILAAALLGLLFPWQLVAAIRTPTPTGPSTTASGPVSSLGAWCCSP